MQVQEAFGLAPGRILHVGDHPETDVLGAGLHGFRAAWLNDRGQPISQPRRQVERRAGGRAHVQAALDDDGRDGGEGRGVREQLPLAQEPSVHEVVVLDAGEGDGVAGLHRP